jgi:3',5'-cyclic AMP phosphodiesterase CpdA
MSEQITRRGAIRMAGATAAALLVASAASRLAGAQVAVVPSAGAIRKRGLRIAHLTDIHVQPELRAGEGLSACLRHVNGLADKPDLIVTGGDQVFDSFDQGAERTQKLWDLWRSCFKNDNAVPVQHVLGNHDIWGWNKKKSKCTGEEARFGKAWACEMFERDRAYTSFDKGGWHIVLLDSVQATGEGYVGKLDDEQFAWLEQDLKQNTAPVAVFSHIPIFSVCVFNDGA